MEPPFVVGRPVTGRHFVNREAELRRLLSLVRGVEKGSSSNAALIGLRRTGKTSILENLVIKLKPNRQIVPILLNCYGLATKSRFAKVLADTAVASYVHKTGDKAYLTRLARATSEGAKAALEMVSEIKFSEFAVKFRDKQTEDDSLIEDALRYIDSLATEKSIFFVIMLDEFQDIMRWGDNTLKRIRTIMQSQKNICYILTGSATTVMRELVYDRRSPFYRQLIEIPVKKLDQEVVKNFLKARFASVRIECEDAQTDRIAVYSGGYPDYVQRLGLELFLSVGERGSISEKLVDNVYEHVILTLDGEFENYFVSFSPLEREVLVALGTGSIQPSEVAREVRKPIFNISKTLTTLMNYGMIERPMKGHYRLADPVFADWLTRRFKPLSAEA